MINVGSFKIIMELHHLNQSELAKICKLSRQCISLWFKKDSINLKTSQLNLLSQNLKIPVSELVNPLPEISSNEFLENININYSWDGKFESGENFLILLSRKFYPAVARFVQVNGMFESSQILGSVVWKKFHDYKKFILPQKRKECEILWNLTQNLNLH